MADMTLNINFPREISEDEHREFLEELGTRLQGRMQENFSDRAEGEWKPRRVPNIAGIITDLEKGPRIKDPRFSEDVTGVDTGRLMGSFSPRGIIDMNDLTVSVGTNVEYAESFHFGIPSRLELSAIVQRNMRIWQHRNRDKMNKHNLWWIMSRKAKTVIINPKPRPLLTEQQARRIAQEIMDEMYGRP